MKDFLKNVAATVVGIILFFVLGCEFFIRYRFVFRKKKASEAVIKENEKEAENNG